MSTPNTGRSLIERMFSRRSNPTYVVPIESGDPPRANTSHQAYTISVFEAPGGVMLELYAWDPGRHREDTTMRRIVPEGQSLFDGITALVVDFKLQAKEKTK